MPSQKDNIARRERHPLKEAEAVQPEAIQVDEEVVEAVEPEGEDVE